MKPLARLLTTSRAKPVFAPDYDAARAMRVAELKWLLAEIAAPRDDRAA